MFGRVNADWSEPATPQAAARARAAQMQHQAAIHARAFLSSRQQTQGQLAERLGWRRERLSRVLLGQVWATLTDLEEILGACETDIAGITFASLPPSDRFDPMKQIVAGYLRDQLRKIEESQFAFAATRPSKPPR